MDKAPHEVCRSGRGTRSGRTALLTTVLALMLIASAGFLTWVPEESNADASGECGDGVTYTYTESTKTLDIVFTSTGTYSGKM
ncbi:MAG: hypothetical protein E7Z65_00825 [Thermoplasmata archaeon]|nr:hypothetical protein [Thermoplasmata archaeon]